MERFALAYDTVTKAAAILRQCHLREEDIHIKTDHKDLVTYYDRRTEQILRESILDSFPQDAIVGEEYPPANSGGAPVTWYLDPIDGTTNFINQHRNYAISVGCWEQDRPLFGLVMDVERQLLYWAKRGEGAWCNEEPIHVSRRESIGDMLLTIPGIQHAFLDSHPYQQGFFRLAREVRGVRGIGSVALELCEVAAGESDLLAAAQSCPWDHNAGRIIVQEAGGAVFTLDGNALPIDSKTTLLAMNSADRKNEILHLLKDLH